MAVDILRREDPEYEYYREGRVFARNPLDRFPAGISRPNSVQDVIEAVKYAKQHQLRIGVRSGGHCHNAPAVRDNSLLIDLKHLEELSYDAKTRILTASPSSTGRIIQPLLKPYGVFFPGGHCPDVALGGFLSQGGAGFMWRSVGWAASLIRWMDVVTADGQLLHCSPTQNSDLMWAFMGAGHGYFAAVVRFGLGVIPLTKFNLRSFMIFPGSMYRQVMKWSLEEAEAVPPATEFYLVAVKRKDFMPGGNPDEIILRVQCASWCDSEAAAKKSIAFIKECPFADKAYVSTFEESVTLDDEYAFQDTISFLGTYINTSGWIEGSIDSQVDLLEEAFTELPSPQSNSIMYSCHPYGPSSKHNLANDISAGTYAFSYTIAALDDRDPAQPAKVSEWTKRVWGEIDRKSGEAIASGDDSKARSKGLYLGDCNLQHRGGRFMSEENWARWLAIRAKHDPKHQFVGFLKHPDFIINWNAWEGKPASDRPVY